MDDADFCPLFLQLATGERLKKGGRVSVSQMSYENPTRILMGDIYEASSPGRGAVPEPEGRRAGWVPPPSELGQFGAASDPKQVLRFL